MIFIVNARLRAELENISFCYPHQLVNLMIASRKSVCLDECKHQSRFLMSVRLKVSMCQNSYQNKRQGIGNIPVTKLHRLEGHRNIKLSGNVGQIKKHVDLTLKMRFG